jgi:hypothetical protein
MHTAISFNGELHDFDSSLHTTRVINSIQMRCRGHVAQVKRREIQVGKPEGKGLLPKLRHIQHNNIKMDIKEI